MDRHIEELKRRAWLDREDLAAIGAARAAHVRRLDPLKTVPVFRSMAGKVHGWTLETQTRNGGLVLMTFHGRLLYGAGDEFGSTQDITCEACQRSWLFGWLSGRSCEGELVGRLSAAMKARYGVKTYITKAGNERFGRAFFRPHKVDQQQILFPPEA